MRIAKYLAALAVCTIGSANAADLLTVGSDAPALDIEHWVQDGKGKFEPVTKFSSGKVYVVEFWATWCGPCIQSMPHLAKLQKDYADKGVQIVSISDEDLETVEKFLERPLKGGEEDTEEKKTYRDLTSAYCLTTDPDQSSYEDYMQAAAQNGIPTAFIVGKDAKIEWIGHPMSMDGPLEAVVAGSWDRKAFAEEMKARQEAEKMMQDIMVAVRGQDMPKAIELINGALEKDATNMQLNMLKMQILVMAKKNDDVSEFASSLFTKLADDAMATNMVAWQIYEWTAQGRMDKGEIQVVAQKAALEAVEKSPAEQKGSILDTLAHLLYLNGNLDEAIAVEKKALELASDSDRAFIEKFMKELEAAKEKGSEETAEDDK